MPLTFRQKALTDPYYSTYASAPSQATDAELLAAGFFDDGLAQTIEQHASWAPRQPTTPLGKLINRLKTAPPGARCVVLLTTGSFSPVHQGHLAMMASARSTLEQAGMFVAGGYLSPSHDAYVTEKLGGAAKLHCEHRIALLEEAVADSDWLSVCPWESRYAPTSLNFTDVLRRLEAYLQTWVPRQLSVAYVFGSDNQAFLHAFEGKGLAVCVLRSGTMLTSTEGAGWAQGRWHSTNTTPSGSSTQVRAGQLTLIPELARPRYVELRRPTDSRDTAPLTYLIRNDLRHGCSSWPAVSIEAVTQFEGALQALIREAFASAQPSLKIQSLLLEAQEIEMRRLCEASPVVSLDACIPADARLDISRLFDLSGAQVYSRDMGTRPGHPALSEQLSKLPKNCWLVVDDDTASGTTERYVRDLLTNADQEISGFAYLNELLLRVEKEPAAMLDIVDARDFLLGARDSGLVVRLSTGEITRAPYALPFVNLVFRAKLPPEKLMSFSIELWLLNKAWFQEFAPHLSVAESGTTQPLLAHLGFQAGDKLHQVASHFATWLQNCRA